MRECSFGVVFCWQKCRHCAFPVKKDPRSFLLNWAWCHQIFSSHTTRAILAGKPWDNLHSFIYYKDQSFTILKVQCPQRSVWLSLSPPPAGRQEAAERHSQAPSLWTAGERKARQAEFSLCFHCIGATLEASTCVCFGYGLLPRVVVSPAKRGNGEFLSCWFMIQIPSHCAHFLSQSTFCEAWEERTYMTIESSFYRRASCRNPAMAFSLHARQCHVEKMFLPWWCPLNHNRSWDIHSSACAQHLELPGPLVVIQSCIPTEDQSAVTPVHSHTC